MGRAEAKEHTREALLAAAALCFVDQGVEGPSLDAICAKAGRTRGAFYVHFADREALVAAVVGRTIDEYIDALAAALSTGTVHDAVQAIADLLVAGPHSDHLFLRIGTRHFHLVLHAAARYPAVQAQLERSVHDGTVLLASALGPDHQGQAELMVALLIGLLAYRTSSDDHRIERIRTALQAVL